MYFDIAIERIDNIRTIKYRKVIRMEEFKYLYDMSDYELIEVIINMIDYEETTRALIVLETRDEKKALDIGKEIIINNKGDDYLQATVWNILFYNNKMEMIEAIDDRDQIIGKSLLDEIIIDITNYIVDVREEFLERIKSDYFLICDEDKKGMRCDFENFIGTYFK